VFDCALNKITRGKGLEQNVAALGCESHQLRRSALHGLLTEVREENLAESEWLADVVVGF